jgi:hypothetical protein
MTATITRFPLPRGIEIAAVKKGFLEVAPKFQDAPGLLRKYFLISQDGKFGGGVYLWKSMEQARRFSEEVLRPMIEETFNAEPSIVYYDAPLIVDNVVSQITADEETSEYTLQP